jgi:hypothetical protein
MKSSMKGQEKSDLLIDVTAWAGLTVLSTDDHRSVLPKHCK